MQDSNISKRKYYSETEDDCGNALQWPGTLDGFPVRGDQQATANLKQEETENISIEMDYRIKKFNLAEPEAVKSFQDVMDRIANGWFRLFKRTDIQNGNDLIIWLEWVQIYGEAPNAKTPPAN